MLEIPRHSARTSRRLPGAARYVLITVAIIASGFLFYPGSEAVELQTVTVETGDLEEVVTAQGKLEPRDFVNLGAQVSGQLEKLHFLPGDIVKAGDLIAEIDPQLFAAQVEGDKARLKTLEAQYKEQVAFVAQARLVKERNEKLLASKAVSQEVFEQSQTDLVVASARLEALSAQIEEAKSTLEGNETKLTYTKIFSPIDGTIVSQAAREGETLNANQITPTVVQVADLDVMTARAQVAEADITRLHQGMDVYFNTLGSSGRRWNGKIRQILPTPEIINDVVLYNVLVDVENKDRMLLPQMSAQMFFVLGRVEQVPLIPVSILKKRLPEQDRDGERAYLIQVLENKKPVERVIRTGLMSRSVAEVKNGITAGEKIIVVEASFQNDNENRRRRTPRL